MKTSTIKLLVNIALSVAIALIVQALVGHSVSRLAFLVAYFFAWNVVTKED